MEKKPAVTTEQLAAFKDGKLPEKEREKVLAEISKDPELYEELCALEELRLGEQAGFPTVPDELHRKALASFRGSVGSKMIIFLSGKAIPIAAAVVCAAALIYFAVYYVGREKKTSETATGAATAKVTGAGAGRKSGDRRIGRAGRKLKSEKESRKAPRPRKTDPYGRFRHKVPSKKWAATRKLLDDEAKKLLAEFGKEKPADEVVYALAIKGKDVLPQILEFAGSGSDEHRARSLEILGLMAVFGHLDEKQKKSASEVISGRLANDSLGKVKEQALDSLEKLRLKDKETFSILANALGDPDAAFRAKVVGMLPRYSRSDAAHKISELLDSDPSPDVKAACIDAAKKVGPVSDNMLEAIGRLMDGASDPRVRYSAISFMKSNAPKTDDDDQKKEFNDRIFRALVAVVETDAGGEPVKPGTRASRYTKKDVMPDVETRIMALELLVRSAGKEEKDSAETTVVSMAGGSSRPALQAAALLSIGRFNRERAFEMLIEAAKSVPIDDQKDYPAYGLYCRKLDSIARQSFGLKAGQPEGDYYAAIEKAENWFSENRHTLTPKQAEGE